MLHDIKLFLLEFILPLDEEPEFLLRPYHIVLYLV